MNTGRIQQIVEEMLDKLNVDYERVDVAEGEIDGTTKYVIVSGETGILIGKDGKHLSALGHLIRRFVERETVEGDVPNFFVDVGNYQKTKIEQIQAQARTMAERARSFKRDVELPPMSAYERMLVHSVLSHDRELRTQSEGSGKHRRIVIRYSSD